MVVRVKLIGSGTKADPHRASLPTYQEILTLVSQGRVYVLIPDEDHPDLMAHPHIQTEETGHGRVLVALDASGHQLWYSHLDDRYQEHSGEYRPEVV